MEDIHLEEGSQMEDIHRAGEDIHHAGEDSLEVGSPVVVGTPQEAVGIVQEGIHVLHAHQQDHEQDLRTALCQIHRGCLFHPPCCFNKLKLMEIDKKEQKREDQGKTEEEEEKKEGCFDRIYCCNFH